MSETNLIVGNSQSGRTEIAHNSYRQMMEVRASLPLSICEAAV